MSQLSPSIEHGGGGGAIVASGAVTIPSDSVVIAYTSFHDTATVLTVGNPTISTKVIPKGITVFGRWSTFTGNTADQGIAYFG